MELENMASTSTFSRSKYCILEFKIIDKIGEGSFSEVLKCVDLQTCKYVAVKRLKKKYTTWDEASDLAELVIMQKIPHHPNVLSLLGIHYDSPVGTVSFVFDLMDMSLYDYMETRKKCIPELRAKHFLFQILCGLHHLHEFGVFHRDIKPENILIKVPLDTITKKVIEHCCELIKIGDLGSVKNVNSDPPHTEYISTRWYRSPECLLTKGYYESKMDIWAVGCVFYEMLTTKPLFPGTNEIDQLSKIHHVLGSPQRKTLWKLKEHKSCNWKFIPKQNGVGLQTVLPNVSSDGNSVMKMMIQYDPDNRATSKHLLAHKYFYILRNMTEKRSASVPSSISKSTKVENKSLKASTSIHLRKPQLKRSIYRATEGQGIFTSVTENNLLQMTQYSDYKNSSVLKDLKLLQKKNSTKINSTIENYGELLKGMEFSNLNRDQISKSITNIGQNNRSKLRSPKIVTMIKDSNINLHQKITKVQADVTKQIMKPINELTNKNTLKINCLTKKKTYAEGASKPLSNEDIKKSSSLYETPFKKSNLSKEIKVPTQSNLFDHTLRNKRLAPIEEKVEPKKPKLYHIDSNVKKYLEQWEMLRRK